MAITNLCKVDENRQFIVKILFDDEIRVDEYTYTR